MGEFELIERYFTRPARGAALGVGDDCALLEPAPGMQLAISSDMLVEGRHFLAGADPQRLGHKCLAVNLSDLAACGAKPVAFTLALALPQARGEWLEPFARGLLALADAHGCELIGGDTTRGPLTICITVFGEVPRGQALLRSGARAGDDVWASGTVGDARLALEALRGTVDLPADILADARERMDVPQPRVALGSALRGVATAAVDISDGLLGDLGHVLRKSGVGATIEAALAMELLAANPALARCTADFSYEKRLDLVLAGGDDYELAFTAPAQARAAVQAAADQAHTRVTRIGRIDAEPGIRVVDAHGRPIAKRFASFDHFAGSESP